MQQLSTKRAPECDVVRTFADLDVVEHFLRRHIDHRHRVSDSWSVVQQLRCRFMGPPGESVDAVIRVDTAAAGSGPSAIAFDGWDWFRCSWVLLWVGGYAAALTEVDEGTASVRGTSRTRRSSSALAATMTELPDIDRAAISGDSTNG